MNLTERETRTKEQTKQSVHHLAQRELVKKKSLIFAFFCLYVTHGCERHSSALVLYFPICLRWSLAEGKGGVCMFVYLCVYTYIYVHIHIYTCVYICIYKHINIHTGVCIYMHVFVYMHESVYVWDSV